MKSIAASEFLDFNKAFGHPSVQSVNVERKQSARHFGMTAIPGQSDTLGNQSLQNTLASAN